jgi:hypothetical protein
VSQESKSCGFDGRVTVSIFGDEIKNGFNKISPKIIPTTAAQRFIFMVLKLLSFKPDVHT